MLLLKIHFHTLREGAWNVLFLSRTPNHFDTEPQSEDTELNACGISYKILYHDLTFSQD